MKSLSKVLFTAASLVAMAGTALAQDPPAGEEGGTTTEGEAGAEAGAEVTPPEGDPAATTDPAMAAPGAMPPLTGVGAGKIRIAGSTVNINLSKEAVGEPISLAPSVYYGVSDKLAVGLTHDGGTTAFTPRPAAKLVAIDLGMGVTAFGAVAGGICITGEEKGCRKVYDNFGVDALFSIKEDKFSVAAHGGLEVVSLDPGMDLSPFIQLRAGILGRFMASEKLAITFDPRILIGVTERDFNKEVIDVPVWVWFMANPKLGVYAHTGIAGPLDGFGDAYTIPLGIGASYGVNEKLSVGGDFYFPDALGKTEADFDARVLAIRAAYAM